MIRAALSAIPLLVIPVAMYALLTPILGHGPLDGQAHVAMTRALVAFRTAGGGVWTVSASDLLLAAGLVIAFLDLLRGPKDRNTAVINHAMSIALFVLCLLALALAPAFACSTFFLLTLMVLLDLVAGFIVATAPPDVEAGPRRRGR
ncbi:MAG TPA: hypothetical protein VH353_04940 [Caulobacteraceae bacterium]|jgi:hypothetical protein|nr:hypothetical protein [Caulobacteraceae bacterium]